MSIIITWGRLRPPIRRNSTTLSRVPESELPACMIGFIFWTWSSAKRGEEMMASRDFIQLMLPRRVLISPLCASVRKGCASGHVGRTFVEKRLWMRASADSKASSERSG